MFEFEKDMEKLFSMTLFLKYGWKIKGSVPDCVKEIHSRVIRDIEEFVKKYEKDIEKFYKKFFKKVEKIKVYILFGRIRESFTLEDGIAFTPNVSTVRAFFADLIYITLKYGFRGKKLPSAQKTIITVFLTEKILNALGFDVPVGYAIPEKQFREFLENRENLERFWKTGDLKKLLEEWE